MPYKDKKKQAEYLKNYKKDYMKPYMKEYRHFKSQQQRKLQEAVRMGKLNMAKEILNKKPSINVFGTANRKRKSNKEGR